MITPGQLGPIKVLFLFFIYDFTFIISLIGIPSVIATIISISVSMDSRIASAANAGGTNIIETLALVLYFAF